MVWNKSCSLMLAGCGSLAIISGCTEIFSGTIVSDVPCITPQWENVIADRFRNEFVNGGRFLFTAQTVEQAEEDFSDGVRDYFPHEAVYAYDLEAKALQLVDGDVWDLAAGIIIHFTTGGDTENFDAFGGGSFSGLTYMGQPVAVAGGHVSGVLDSNGDGPIVAVVSSSGSRAIGLLGTGGAAGQYYHQLFSEDTGSPVGSAVRLGLGNGTDRINAFGAWTSDNRHVVYQSGQTFCITDGISE